MSDVPGDFQEQIDQLNQLVAQLYQHGQYQEAITVAEQSRDLARQHLGEDHPDFAQSLNNLAHLYQEMGKYAQAEPLYRQASEIWRKALGEEHPDFATSLNNLAALYRRMGNYAQAEPLYRQAMKIRRNSMGEDHPDFGASLNNLALLYELMGNYAGAEPLYRQAMEIWRARLGEDHPNFATSLNNLAHLYQEMGKYAQAEPLYQQAMEIRRTSLGEDHPDYARSLNNLAGLYYRSGNYAGAEPLYRQAMEIRRTSLGEDHPDSARSLNNLALLYESMGNYAAAESLCRQATEIWRTTLGEDHPDFARSLNNLALLYESMGNYAQAEPLYRHAMEILRTSLGEDHPEFARSLNNLAHVYESMGNYAGAEPLYRQAMEMRRTSLGEDHPHFAITLNNLAELYYAMGDYAQAEPLLRQATEILRVALGEDHPDFAISLNNLAVLCAGADRPDEGLPLMQKAARIDDGMIGQVFSIGSESQRTAFLATVQAKFEAFLSLVCQHFQDSPEAIRSALELVLRRKAIGAEALAAQRDAVLGGKYPHLRPQIDEIGTLRAQIAQKTLAGPGPEGLEQHKQLLNEWNRRKDQMEAELARQVPEMNLQQQLQAADRRALALGLPQGVALVEFVRFHVADFHAVAEKVSETEWKPPRPWQPARYIAFVLRAGEPDNVEMIDLGEAEDIDRMIANFRSGITGEAEDRGGRPMVAVPEPIDGADDGARGAGLRAGVFDKLLPALKECNRLFLAPDGDLNRLPFEALPTEDGRRLIDDYQISYLSVGRDVLRFGAVSSGQPGQPLVVADPDFDLSATGTAGSVPRRAEEEVGAERAVAGAGRHSRDLDRSRYHFGRLPGTRVEGQHISSRLGVEPWLDRSALEGRLKKACRSPRILHLATHGFFLEDQRRDPEQLLRQQLGLSGVPDRLAGPGLENPLLRSGLALSGANTWLAHGELPPEAQDGLLTAEDVSGLDLLATELVVLSACQTGLGEIRTGEGVFGLRRAFVLAGAKTLVMSLWKVPDEQTQELMDDFYSRLHAGQGRAEALREAQLAMKQKYPHPRNWAAFICQGDPSPMPGLVSRKV